MVSDKYDLDIIWSTQIFGFPYKYGRICSQIYHPTEPGRDSQLVLAKISLANSPWRIFRYDKFLAQKDQQTDSVAQSNNRYTIYSRVNI